MNNAYFPIGLKILGIFFVIVYSFNPDWSVSPIGLICISALLLSLILTPILVLKEESRKERRKQLEKDQYINKINEEKKAVIDKYGKDFYDKYGYEERFNSRIDQMMDYIEQEYRLGHKH